MTYETYSDLTVEIGIMRKISKGKEKDLSTQKEKDYNEIFEELGVQRGLNQAESVIINYYRSQK